MNRHGRAVRRGPTFDQTRVRGKVRDAAARLGLKVSFGEGRRSSDVTLVVVKGPRATVLRSCPELIDGLGLDVELVRCAHTPEDYEMVLALMLPRAQRERVEQERRASEIGGGDR